MSRFSAIYWIYMLHQTLKQKIGYHTLGINLHRTIGHTFHEICNTNRNKGFVDYNQNSGLFVTIFLYTDN